MNWPTDKAVLVTKRLGSLPSIGGPKIVLKLLTSISLCQCQGQIAQLSFKYWAAHLS